MADVVVGTDAQAAAPSLHAAARARRRAPIPSPAVLAERLEHLQRGHRRWRAERATAKAALNALYQELPAEELFQRIPAKLAGAVSLHLAGWNYPAIAEAIGYSGRPSSATTVMKLLQRPESKKLIRDIRQRQFDRLVAGEFGVTAAARAAAPRIMAEVAALAGGVPGPDGAPQGKAPRPADRIKAADLAFQIGGYKVQRREVTYHHVLDSLNDDELERLAVDGQWPARLAELSALLPGAPPPSSGPEAPGVPRLEPPRTPAGPHPCREGLGRR
jgi:hypothetical protein